MIKLEHLLQGMEEEFELKAIKEKLASVEAQIRECIFEKDMDLFLEWDTLWGDYADFCVNYVYTKMRQ